MANPTEVDGWRVDGAEAYGPSCEIIRITGGKLEIGGEYAGSDPSLPVLLAMLRAVGYEIKGPGGE